MAISRYDRGEKLLCGIFAFVGRLVGNNLQSPGRSLTGRNALWEHPVFVSSTARWHFFFFFFFFFAGPEKACCSLWLPVGNNSLHEKQSVKDQNCCLQLGG